MTMRRFIGSAGALLLACVMLVTVEAQRGAGAGQGPPAGRGGGSEAPLVGQGTLIAGAWGKDPLPVDSRGWGWMTKSYVSANYKRPFWNRAKELLFSGKQVTSYTISTFDPDFYCEVRKHYGFVWF